MGYLACLVGQCHFRGCALLGRPVSLQAKYFATMVAACWETGLRRVDLHLLKRSQIPDGGGSFAVIRHKTKRLVWCHISTATLAAIDAMRSERGEEPDTDVIWPELTSYERFRCDFRLKVEAAKVPLGAFKQLRTSAGTAVELAHPGRDHIFLGNNVFHKNYFDRRQMKDGKGYTPPEL